MSDFILVWQNGTSNVLSHNAFFHGTEKPELSFTFDQLVCETPTNVYFRMCGDNQFFLTEEQIAECGEYCESFYENGDYGVFAYDPERDNLYKGFMKRSECAEKGYKYVVDVAPESDACSWDEENSKWITWYAAIMENGHMRVAIDKVCDLCVKLLTREEYDEFPKPERGTDSWDFETETWMDKRDVDEVKRAALIQIRNNWEGLRIKDSGEYVGSYERETWRIQLAEAQAYLEDPNAETPYIDAFLENRTDYDVPTKEELVADIIEHNEQFTAAMAKLSAEMWYWKKRVSACSTGYEVDDVLGEFTQYFSERIKG